MPSTNRPFFFNFFAAFRAHSALQKAPPSSMAVSTSSSGTAAMTTELSRSATTKASSSSPQSGSPATAVAIQAASHFRSSRSALPQYRAHSSGSSTSLSSSPSSPSSPPPRTSLQANRSPSQCRSPPAPLPIANKRRGSDASSSGAPFAGYSSPYSTSPGVGDAGGFREALKAEKWYIGGRTAAGEEKFYKLGLVKGYNSNDRLSLDRLSI